MKKQIVPLMLMAAILVACNNSSDNAQSEKPATVAIAKDETNEAKDDKMVVQDDDNKEKSDFQKKIESDMEKIKAQPKTMVIDGVEAEPSPIESHFAKNFNLKSMEESSDVNPDLMAVSNLYQTDKGNKLMISAVDYEHEADEEAYYLSILDIDNTDIKLPYDISTSDDYKTAKEKLMTNDAYFPYMDSEGYSLILFAGDYGFSLNYENDRADRIDIYKVSDNDIKMGLVMREYMAEYPEDNNGTITLAGKEFAMPIKLDKLEEILGVKSETPTAEEMKEIGLTYFDEYPDGLVDYRIFRMAEGNVVSYYFNEAYAEREDQAIDAQEMVGDIYSVIFKRDMPFELKNGDMDINNDNIDTEKNKYLLADQADEVDPANNYFYLDDNQVVTAESDVITIENSIKSVRDYDRFMARISREMETDPFIKDLFYDYMNYRAYD